MMICRLLLV